MLRFLKSFFAKKNEAVEQAPYKVETPAVTPIMIPPVAEPVKCGCGRSATGYCTGLHKLSQEEWAAHPDNPVKPAPANKPAAKKASAKKKPAEKAAKPAEKAAKPAAMTASKKRTSKKTPG